MGCISVPEYRIRPTGCRPPIISRDEWGPLPYNVYPATVPKNTIIIHHTAGGMHETIRTIDDHHRNHIENLDGTRGMTGGIAYHFVIGRDGSIYQGRLTSWVGGHAGARNPGSIGIALMGDFTYELPTGEQLFSLQRLVTYLLNSPNYSITVIANHHGQCPGRGVLFFMENVWGNSPSIDLQIGHY